MTKGTLPAVSPAETEILRLVWQLDKATVQDVCDRLPAKRKIAYATVQTLLRRLEKKGYLRHYEQGKAHVFFNAVKSEDVIKRSVGDFVERLFGGEKLAAGRAGRAESHRVFLRRAVLLFHHAGPDSPCRAELCGLFEDVHCASDEE